MYMSMLEHWEERIFRWHFQRVSYGVAERRQTNARARMTKADVASLTSTSSRMERFEER